MAVITRSLLLLITLAAAMALMAHAAASVRELGVTSLASDSSNSKPGMDIPNCWNALSEVRMCSNEIIGFFLNGVAEIDAPCCIAIEVIMHHCMPDMLGTLGFTIEQGRLLQGYCDKTSATTVPAPPANLKHA
ncbi:hypothetical protein Dimus_014655 [Dionaea muscipula]